MSAKSFYSGGTFLVFTKKEKCLMTIHASASASIDVGLDSFREGKKNFPTAKTSIWKSPAVERNSSKK